ncbi:MAG: FHA domain-containing protein [Betaproteobacteria bacterium]|nr:FHA domain-containing protein [Betaproteobacteria bacterium]
MGARIVISLEGAIVYEFALSKPVTVVGRHRDCDMVIKHPAVSGRHMLLRLVGTSVYAEDLGSTNGLVVNGILTENHVLHHLDAIEIGLHKLHFFDDALLSGKIGSLECTVLTDYERTVMSAHVAAERLAAPATPTAKQGWDDLAHAMVMERDPSLRAPKSRPAGVDAAPTACELTLRVVKGPHEGETLQLERAHTMIGHAGGDTALVVRRGQSLFIARLSGQQLPRLNGRDLGPGTHPLAPDDVIEVGGARFQVIQAARNPAVAPQG